MADPLRAVLIGNGAVGKTSLYGRFQDLPFAQTIPTLGAAHTNITLTGDDGTKVTILLFDTAGQDAYRSIIPLYFRNASFVILVYDITDPDSFNEIEEWISLARSKAPEEALFLLIGNKCDLEESRAISVFQGDERAKAIGATFFETSAATGSGIAAVLHTIAEMSVAHALAVERLHPASVRAEEIQCC
jgi:small GTP-binding protein